jgi:PEP-CTERM motif
MTIKLAGGFAALGKSNLLMMVVAAGVFGASAAAYADIVTVTYTGPVILVSDANGTLPSASEGDTLVATYVFNLPNATNTMIDPMDGGFAYGPYGSFAPASLTINGVAAALPAFATGQLTGEIHVFDTGTVLSANVDSSAPGDQLESLLNSENFSWSLIPPLTGLSYTVSNDDEEAITQLTTAAGDLLEADIANVTVSVTSPPTPPVPEPSTWAMMLIGFGGIGVFAYLRRRVTAFVPV